MKMKIAFFSDTFYPQVNGVVTSILNSSRILAEMGHRVHIFTIKTNKPIKLHKNITLSRYKSINAFNYPGFELVIPKALSCLKKIKEFKPDIIHVHTPTILGWLGLVCGKILDTPVVGTYHTLVPDFLKHSHIPKISDSRLGKNLAWKYTNKFYAKCDIVTTPSESTKNELIKNGLKKRIEIVSNGIDLSLFRPKKGKHKEFRILYVGRISYEKKIDVVLKAVSLFSQRCNNFVLWIIGSGPDLEKLKRLAKDLKIEKQIRFFGMVDNEKLPAIYSNSDVFVTASTIETEGIALLEAMACNLPIIGVNARAIPKIVRNNFNGFVVRAGNFNAMSNAIWKLYRNAKLREKMGAKGRIIAKKYDVRKCVEKLETIFNTLISDSISVQKH